MKQASSLTTASVLQFNLFQSGVRSMPQLPALSPSSATDPGPLRVTVHYHHNPALGSIAGANRATPSALRHYARSYTDNVVSAVSTSAVGVDEGRGVRRVRFDLPPKPPLPSLLHSGATSGKLGQQKQTAGVESWLRSRAGISSSFGSSLSHDPQLNNSAGGGRLTGASRAVVATTAVAAARTHDTERYRRGTLPPTSPPGAACPGIDCSPEAAALLKAARDGDEDALGVALREADRTGIPVEHLNCQDGSGRVSTLVIVMHAVCSPGNVDGPSVIEGRSKILTCYLM